MINLTIFGTGISAERAWNALADFQEFESFEGVRVLSFADNDPARRSARFHDLPVRSPEQLVPFDESDYIVIASQWHAVIEAQLRDLGMPSDRILSWDGDPDALYEAVIARARRGPVSAAGSRVDRQQLPRVLILSHETLNDSHGTGVLLKRYFEQFPERHLFSVAHRDAGRAWLAQSLRMRDASAHALRELRAAMDDAQFHPDLVFATVLHETDLALLDGILSILPPGTPVVQHFMDFLPHDERAFVDQFAALLPRITEVWALTDALQSMLARRLNCDVHLVTGLLQHVTRSTRVAHRDFGPDFRTAMVGNFYNPRVVEFIRAVWSRCRASLPGLGPVEWYVSPARIQGLLDSGLDPGLDFVWRGFFRGPALLRKLAAADLGLLALNHESAATTNYLRYSLPSRITEFACAGVPLFAVTSPDTPLATFIARHGNGVTSSGPDPDCVAADLCRLIQERGARAAAGAAGRRLAEESFGIERFRDWFNGRIAALARRSYACA